MSNETPNQKNIEKMDKYTKNTRTRASETSKKMLNAGWSLFGDIQGILKYSDEEEIEVARSTRMFFYVLVSGFVLTILWMALSPLAVVSIADGDVSPSSSVQSVQHFEGGIIKEIPVKEGDRVSRGDVLLVLESTASGASVTELASRIASLKADIIRFEAQAKSSNGDNIEPEYPEDLKATFPEIIRQSKQVYNASMNRYLNDVQGAREKLRQREQDVREVQARLNNLHDRLDIAVEQVTISEGLLKDNLTNRYNHLELLREVSVINSSIEEDKAGLDRALSQMEEAKGNQEGIRVKFLEDINMQMEDASSQLSEADERMIKLQDSLKRTQLTSPVDGIVQTIVNSTVGGVVKPGESVVDVVPIGDQLIIEAKLPVSDIGYVAVGQEATIRLASSDAMRFEKLYGHVTFIAPDTTKEEETGEYFYKVRVETKQSKFTGAGGLVYQLYPGMKVTANIVTGQRTILEYVISPFMEASYDSLQER